MTENRFDKEIKEALKDHQIDIPSSDWSTMNEILNQEFGFQDDPVQEKEFDNSISSKMNADLSEYNHAHWDLLLKRLEKEEEKHFHATIRKILRYVAILLLFISIYNWQGNNLFPSESPNATIVNNGQDKTKKANETYANVKYAEAKEIEFSNDRSISRNRNKAKSPIVAAAIANTSLEQIAANITIANSDLQLQKPSKVLISNQVSKEMLVNSVPNLVKRVEIQKPVVTEKLDLKEHYTLDILSLDPLASERRLSNKTPILDFKDESKDFSLSLGVMASPDLYLIRSPEDPIYPLPSYYTGSSGLSGGITFSAEKNNVELLTGLSYSSVSYQPRDYTEVYRSRGKFYQTSLNNIFFNSISVPVNFNIYFDVASSSRVYLTLGTTFNTIINSNFDIAENQIPQPTGVPVTRKNNSLLESKDFDEGIFEGGSLFDNTYFTGDIGIGFLREFKNDWSFYLQPTLHTQYTEGIGPNQDYLHKLSIYAGLKYSL